HVLSLRDALPSWDARGGYATAGACGAVQAMFGGCAGGCRGAAWAEPGEGRVVLWMDHVGDGDSLQGLADHGVDAQPVVADPAVAFHAAHAGAGAAFGEAEGVVFECVDDVGHADLCRRAAEHIAAVRAALACHEGMAAERLEHLADGGQPQAERVGKPRGAVHTVGHARHVGEDEGAVVGEFADAQHGLVPGRLSKCVKSTKTVLYSQVLRRKVPRTCRPGSEVAASADRSDYHEDEQPSVNRTAGEDSPAGKERHGWNHASDSATRSGCAAASCAAGVSRAQMRASWAGGRTWTPA